MLDRTIAQYRVEAELGRGGMGVVYRARDTRLGREVALKLLPAESPDATARGRQLHEARMASALNHPHIATLYEVGEAEGQFFIAMELVEGKSLAALIPGGGFPAETVARYGAQIADALDHAHARSIVHRDLKSANVIVTPEGRAKVLDFGLAQRLQQSQLDEATRSQVSLGEVKGVAGTLPYMAPEQLRGEPADARTDIWALGVVLHEMATGKLPFSGTTGFSLSSAILRESPLPLPEQMPPGLRAVIQRCLAKEPGQRYQRASEVRAALETLSTTTAAPATAIAAPQEQKVPWKWPASAAAVLVFLAVLFALNVGGLREWMFAPAGAPKIESLAVLPLENLSGDPSQEYFADGMTEALIGNLTQIRALKVISRTSAMRYKGSNKSLPEIARELGVDGVITGSIQRSASRVGINVQLVHAPTDRNLWANSYERDLADVLQLESEVARAIAAEVRVQITPGEQARLMAARPVDTEAYSLYLQGRFYLNKRSAEGLERAIRYFSQAIERAPGYAPAYSGLADSYSLLGYFGFGGVTLREALPRALEAAHKAVELDESSAEVHASLAFVKMRFEWDWASAEHEFQRAIELNPKYPTAHHWYALMLMSLGRRDESYREIMLARELDPASAIVTNVVGLHFYFARDFDRSVEWNQKALELEPDFAIAFLNMGRDHLQKREFGRAIAEMEKAVQISNRTPFYLGHLGNAYGVAGRKAEALKILEELKRESKPGYLSYPIAEVHLGLDDKEEALAWLERAYQERSGWMLYIKVEPKLDPLRSDPRFQALLRRMSFP